MAVTQACSGCAKAACIMHCERNRHSHVHAVADASVSDVEVAVATKHGAAVLAFKTLSASG